MPICPDCGRSRNLIRKLSKYRNRAEKDRIYVFACDGITKRLPHPPGLYHLANESVITDSFGRIVSKTTKITRIRVEDSELVELVDQWKLYMREERYKRLPAKAITVKSL